MANTLEQASTSTIDRFASIFDDLLESPNFWNGLYSPSLLTSLHPVVDVTKNDKEFTFKMEVPGFNKEDIDIEIQGDLLTVKGKRMEEKEEKDKEFIRRERRSGSFQRSFRLGEAVKPNQIEAECKHGILTVKVPKLNHVEAQRVEIR